jgi:hypothetical protein
MEISMTQPSAQSREVLRDKAICPAKSNFLRRYPGREYRVNSRRPVTSLVVQTTWQVPSSPCGIQHQKVMLQVDIGCAKLSDLRVVCGLEKPMTQLQRFRLSFPNASPRICVSPPARRAASNDGTRVKRSRSSGSQRRLARPRCSRIKIAARLRWPTEALSPGNDRWLVVAPSKG